MTQTDSLRQRVTPRALPDDADVERLLAAWANVPSDFRVATLMQLEQVAAMAQAGQPAPGGQPKAN